MSSRSIIAIQKGRTTTTIYCHFDGYPTSVGKILYDNYTDEKKINELMELGNLSSLGETIKDCVFYIRDRHEPADENKAVIIPAIYGKQPKQILELLDSGQNYLYLFKDGIWFYIDMFEKKKFMPLETAINESKNKRSMGNMNKIVKSYEEFVNESAKRPARPARPSRGNRKPLNEGMGSSFELTDCYELDSKQAENIVSDNYPNELTYRGQEFFNKIYLGLIEEFAYEELYVALNGGQESYLGYLPDEDVFISGWDMDSDKHNLMYIKFNSRMQAEEWDDKYSKVVSVGSIYPKTYNKLHKKHNNLIDIRLD